jgi:hypothetical protein
VRAGAVAALLVGLAGCGGDGGGAGGGRPGRATGTASAPLPADEPALCDLEARTVETGALELVTPGGPVALGTGAITLRREGDCERVAIALAGGGAGATRAEFLRTLGVVRFTLDPAVRAVADPDTTFRGPLARAVYVVRRADGGLWVDVHVGAPALARALALADPPRLLLDLTPGGGAVPVPPPRSERVVVLEPGGGALGYPILVRGYARLHGSGVVAELLDGGRVVAATRGTSAGGATTWGAFALRLARGPGGPLTLRVGAPDAGDGDPTGVRIPVRLP